MQKIDLAENPTFAKKVVEAAYDYLTEGASYRNVAPSYGVSYVTIKSWLDKYLPQIDADLCKLVRTAAESRKEKTVDDPEVRERVSKAVALMVNGNLTVVQIAEALETTEWVIYNDLVRRLPQIKGLGDSYYQAVRETLSNHSMVNSPNWQKAHNKEENDLTEEVPHR